MFQRCYILIYIVSDLLEIIFEYFIIDTENNVEINCTIDQRDDFQKFVTKIHYCYKFLEITRMVYINE